MVHVWYFLLFYLYVLLYSVFFLEKYDASIFNVVIGIFKQSCRDDEFFTEALRVLKPDGLLVIYEPLSKCRRSDEKSGTTLAHAERISKLKLSGFKVMNDERESLDEDDLTKNNLHRVYYNVEDVCKVIAKKPPYEVRSSRFYST